MKASLFVVFVALGCLLVSCRRPHVADRKKSAPQFWILAQGPAVNVPNKEKEEWDVTEAIFRYQIRDSSPNPCYLKRVSITQPKLTFSAGANVPNPPPPPDPPPPPKDISLSDEFMRRFSTISRSVRRASDCDATDRGVVDKNTGQEGGDIYTVCDILWITPTEAEVTGGWWAGPDGATSHTYYLNKINGKWQVVGDDLDSIS